TGARSAGYADKFGEPITGALALRSQCPRVLYHQSSVSLNSSPLLWSRHHAELLQHAEHIFLHPFFGDPDVVDTIDSYSRCRDLFACWRNAHQFAALCAIPLPLGYHFISFSKYVHII